MPIPINPKALEKLLPPLETQGFPLNIAETGGRLRQIQLRGTSLPYQGVAFPSKMRVSVDYYAGNNEGQGQVLGGEWLPTDMEGRWSDIKFSSSQGLGGNQPILFNFPPIALPGKAGGGAIGQSTFGIIGGKSFQSAGSIASLTGQPQVVERARTIRDAFYAIQQGGQLLRVEWGSIVRYGYLEEFTPSHDREEDIRWSAKFVWTGETNSSPVPKPDKKVNPKGLLSKVLAALKAFLDEVNKFLLKAWGSILAVQQKIKEVVGVVTGLINAINSIVGLAFAPLELIGTLEQQFNSLKLAALDLVQTILSIPGVYRAYFDRKPPTEAELEAEFLAAILYNTRVLAEEAYRAQVELNQFKNIDIIAVYTVSGFESLRDVSAKVYGDPSGWRDIAEFNNLASVIAPRGATLYIPKRS